MELEKEYACVILPASEWQHLKKTLNEVAEKLSTPSSQPKIKSVSSPYITAKEFMAAVRICRSSFDKLVHKGKIMTLKKGRKVYVVASEVDLRKCKFSNVRVITIYGLKPRSFFGD